MAIEAPKWLSSALRWRWTPSLALILASLVYVLLAIAFVPSEISFSEIGREHAAAPGAVGVPHGLGADTPGAGETEPGAVIPGTEALRASRFKRRHTSIAPTAEAPVEAPVEAQPATPPEAPVPTPVPESPPVVEGSTPL